MSDEGNTVDARHAVAEALLRHRVGPFASLANNAPLRAAGSDARVAVAALEAAGYRVVPADLVENARAMVNDTWGIDPDAVPRRDALAASLGAYDGRDPLDVFEGKP